MKHKPMGGNKSFLSVKRTKQILKNLPDEFGYEELCNELNKRRALTKVPQTTASQYVISMKKYKLIEDLGFNCGAKTFRKTQQITED